MFSLSFGVVAEALVLRSPLMIGLLVLTDTFVLWVAGVKGGVASGDGGSVGSVGCGVLLDIGPTFPRRCAQVHRVSSEDNLLGDKLVVLPELIAVHQEDFSSPRNRTFCFEPVLSPVRPPDDLAVGMLFV